MSNIDLFKSFSLDDLKAYLSLIEVFETKDDIYNALVLEINRREEENKVSLNKRFTIKLFKDLSMFYPDEMHVLEVNGIKNLQDLIDCDLDSMIGITISIKEKFEWARKFYDMSSTSDKNNGKQKRKENRQL